jgi:hypothetical protein
MAPPAPKGDQIKIEDDGTAADQLAAYLADRKLL